MNGQDTKTLVATTTRANVYRTIDRWQARGVL